MATRPWRPVERKSSWRRLALATWRAPDDPTVYGTIDVDMTNALALIDRLRTEQAVHATVTHLVARALALGIASEPSGNGLVIGRRVYQRDSVDIFLQVASEDGQDLSGFKVRGADRVGAAEIARMVQERAERVRQRKDAEVERSKASLDRIP
ncbi:2-oxo acid dehydrogenase subunit E2, partial [bacterium]|nr:2-oxo acid dehydrogenase subunit E2 [bacterium]